MNFLHFLETGSVSGITRSMQASLYVPRTQLVATLRYRKAHIRTNNTTLVVINVWHHRLRTRGVSYVRP